MVMESNWMVMENNCIAMKISYIFMIIKQISMKKDTEYQLFNINKQIYKLKAI